MVPAAWRRPVFDTLHDLAHLSIHESFKLEADRFVWDGSRKRTLGQDLCALPDCKSPVKAPLQQSQPTHRRLLHIHLHIIGPLPVSRGTRYIFTMVDRFTRWPEAVPLSDTSTESCARTLIANLIARFGLPTDITSNRGVQFTPGLWTALAQLLVSRLHHTTAYQPQSNGLVERFLWHLKLALMACHRGPNWTVEIPWVLMGIRTAPMVDLGTPTVEFVYGSRLTVPGELVPKAQGLENTPAAVLMRLRVKIGTMAPVPTSRHGPTPSFTPKDLRGCEYVYIRRSMDRSPLQRTYKGSFKLIRHNGSRSVVEVGGWEETFTVDCLKLAHWYIEEPVSNRTVPARPAAQETHTDWGLHSPDECFWEGWCGGPHTLGLGPPSGAAGRHAVERLELHARVGPSGDSQTSRPPCGSQVPLGREIEACDFESVKAFEFSCL
ncbi:uncharacterized protein [Hemitrygon akajei]|uniref:uncharacterized protein n=1 Tax=Hemitrygon akajei TaxID=2704970 RepID=UPI003BFA2E7C